MKYHTESCHIDFNNRFFVISPAVMSVRKEDIHHRKQIDSQHTRYQTKRDCLNPFGDLTFGVSVADADV